MERKITLRYILLLTFLFVVNSFSYAQVYLHDFGNTTITNHPYTVAPTVLDPDLSNSVWTNSTGSWTSYAGASGEAISLANSSGTPTITLTFDVASGKQLSLTAFDFWHRRSNTGAQNWTMLINGLQVGSGTVPTTGTTIGNTPVPSPVTGLTGQVTVTINLSGATGSGTYRLDNFTLYGSVTDNNGCVGPVITSFYPNSGPANTLVTINGTGFETGTGTSQVLFNGVASSGFTVVSDDEIKAIVPYTATDGQITVVANGCGSTTLASFDVFTSECAGFTPPTDLFISEVYDANTGEGGAIEFYNATSASIDLSQYSFARYGSIGGTTASYTVALSGTLAPNQVYIARTTTEVCGLSGTPLTTLTTGFNDSDELQLLKNGTVIDRVYTPANVGFSMIRNINATAPSAVYNAVDWIISDTEDCFNLGVHSVDTTDDLHISAQPLSAAICEGEQVQYIVTLSDETGFSYQWKMLNSSGVWVNIIDNEYFSGTNTQVLTITDTPLEFNSSQFYCEVTTTNCTLESNAVQLTVSPLPVAVVIPTQPTCLMSTGSLLIVPSVGEGLTYSLDGTNFQSDPIFDNLAPGNYTLTIKSSADCATTLPVTINEPPTIPATPTVSVTQTTCSTPTGSLTITGPVETGFTYSINGTDYQASPTFAGLAPGTYSVTIKTAGGCVSTAASVSINPVPTPPAGPSANITQPTCSVPGGIINITSPLNATYSYSIDGVNYQSTTLFSNVAPGTYTLYVQTADGCNAQTTITINAVPAAPAVPVVTVTQPTCTVNTGSLEITAPVGAQFTYSIDDTNYQAGTTFNDLAPGTYNVTVQNTNGCISQTSVIIEQGTPDEPVATIQQPDCFEPTGTITVTAPMGADLQYSLDGINFQNSPEFTNVAPGTYTLTVEDGTGCTSETTVTVNSAPVSPVIATATVTQPTCLLPQGIIVVTSPVGIGYTYSIDGLNFQAGTTFTGLMAGTYTITVENADGCTSQTEVTLIPATPDTATTTVTQPTCIAPQGTITVTAPVGIGYTYSIDGTSFQAGTTFTNLTEGTYTITVQNAAGCTSEALVSINAVPAGPAEATTTVTQPTCLEPAGVIEITAPLGTEYTYSINGTNFQAGTTFSALAEGMYTVTVKNTDGCTSQTMVTINAIPAGPAQATTVLTQPTCLTPEGSIEITAPLGTEYTYSIDGTNFQSATIFTDLNPGTYTVTVQNTDGCTSEATATINAVPVGPAVATTSVMQPTCLADSGSITIVAPLGAQYTYSIDGINFVTTTTFDDLTPGTYTITVQNTEGCTSQTQVEILPGSPQLATTTLTQPTCAAPFGSIQITAPLGTQYTYSIDGTNFQSSPVFSNLDSGVYSVTVENAVGCTSEIDVTINAVPVGPAVATTTLTQPTCLAPQGAIEVTTPLGTEYTYSIDGTNFQSATTFSNLNPGTYTVTVENTDGCTSQVDVTINAVPVGPAVATTTLTQPTCNTPQGTIVVTAPLGTQYTYSIDDTNFQSPTTFSNLNPGTYTVTVQNTEGCTSQVDVTINAVPAGPAVATTTLTQPTCLAPQGAIEIIAPLGTEYTYSIDGTNFQSATTFSNLNPGTYTVVVENAAGCTSQVDVTINAVPVSPAIATTNVTQPTCDMPGGAIEVTAPLGTEYTYSIDGTNFQSSTTFTGLAAGTTYTLTVQNTDGCTSQTEVAINTIPDAPDAPTYVVTQPNCDGVTSGSIQVTAPIGGVTYSIDGTNFQNSSLFAGLTPGEYTITVKSGNCTSTSGIITINAVPTPPVMPVATVTQPTCEVETGTLTVTAPLDADYTYSIDGVNFQSETEFSGLTAGLYTITVMNGAGCTTDSQPYTINQSPVPAEPDVTVTQPDCFTETGTIEIEGTPVSGYTYSLNGQTPQNGMTFINLNPGTYTVTITNTNNGCERVITGIVINDAPVTPDVANVQIIDPSCITGGGSIIVTAPLGTQYVYSIDNGANFQADPDFDNVVPGTYNVIVMTDAGCTSVTGNFTLDQPTGDITITGTEGCRQVGLDNSYILEISPSGSSYDADTVTYTWTDQFGNTLEGDTMFNVTTYVRDNNINPSDFPIDFTVTVTTPGGCTGDYTFNVVGSFCDIPRGISPNNDGKNDNFDISFMNAKKLSIFNRFGEQVYTQANYKNEWYGQSEKGDLPSGTYFYVIDFENESKTGWVYINREEN